jgi:hypothetical protein
MDATPFDQWTRRFAVRHSRRALIAGLLSLVVVAGPRAASAQSATPVPADDDDDQPDTPADDEGQTGQVGAAEGVCADFVWCKASQMNMRDGTVTTLPVGRIPGGPYETKWCWDCYHLTSDSTIPGCVPIGHEITELEALCNAAFPDMCQGDCCAGALFDIYC